jgi:hypothetical protein
VFSLDPNNFPQAEMTRFLQGLHAGGRKWVPILDPGERHGCMVPRHQDQLSCLYHTNTCSQQAALMGSVKQLHATAGMVPAQLPGCAPCRRTATPTMPTGIKIDPAFGPYLDGLAADVYIKDVTGEIDYVGQVRTPGAG